MWQVEMLLHVKTNYLHFSKTQVKQLQFTYISILNMYFSKTQSIAINNNIKSKFHHAKFIFSHKFSSTAEILMNFENK